MGAMKRLVLLALLVAFAVPAHAGAAVPCRNKVFNDWYADGKIASTYPRGCYADALKHIPPDAQIYSSLADDIRAAMRAAIRRTHGKAVPRQVGHGFTASSGKTVLATGKTPSDGTTGPRSASGPVAAAPVADTTQADGGSSLPLPILILGGLALALAAAGALGSGVRYARGRRRSAPGA